MTTQTDLYGTPIVPGALVAYNWSGRVIRGRVLGVNQNSIVIDPMLPNHYYRQKNPSRVKNGGSVLVLRSDKA